MNSMSVYQNNHYTIITAEDCYHIINNWTGVKEGFSEVLSSAISKCDVWSNLMDEIKERKCDA